MHLEFGVTQKPVVMQSLRVIFMSLTLPRMHVQTVFQRLISVDDTQAALGC